MEITGPKFVAARALVVALLSSMLVVFGPFHTSASANPTPFDYNNEDCNLTDNHDDDGTDSNFPFLITDLYDLWSIPLCDSTNETIYFQLANDIDVDIFGGLSWYCPNGFGDPFDPCVGFPNFPIGYSSAGTLAFSGVLDGNNHSIRGLSMSRNAGVGLFAWLDNATISNLVIEGSFTSTATVTGEIENAGGALAVQGRGNLSLNSISNEASVTGIDFVGGVIGVIDDDYVSVSFDDVRNSGDITASGRGAGGLVGSFEDSSGIELSVRNSANTGIISGDRYVGGLFGYLGNGVSAEFLASNNTGQVSAQGEGVGGLIGNTEEGAIIAASYNSGPISGGDQAGGLMGSFNSSSQISSSYNIGAISGANNVGGLVGTANSTAAIETSYNGGTVSATADASGGLIGKASGIASITDSYNFASVTGGSKVGGLVGEAWGDMSINTSYNAGNVAATVSLEDALLGSNEVGSSITPSSVLSSTPSSYIATSTLAQMRVVSSYADFDFDTVWGFGACAENDGLPMLRVFVQVETYFSFSCGYDTDPNPAQPATPASNTNTTPQPVYSGPIITQAKSVQAGSEVVFTGSRLESVAEAFIGDVRVAVVLATPDTLVLEISSSISAGTYDLVLHSSYGRLSFLNGLTVIAPAVIEAESESTKKLTVGSFRGYVAIYTMGHEGQKLSAKIAGKWSVVPELKESWNGQGFSRTLRLTGAGNRIQVQLFIDGKYMRTVELVTR